jgi:hypothetical protein
MDTNMQHARNFKPAIILFTLAPILALIVNLWEPRLMIAVWFGLSGLAALAFPITRWMRWVGVALLVLATFVTIVLYVAQ